RVFITARANRIAERQIERWSQTAIDAGAQKIVGIMPASATPVNAYPLDAWARVIRDLWHERRALCVLMGGPADQRLLGVISDSLDLPHVRLDRCDDLMATCALIARLDALLAVDTGLAHVAVAQN